MIRKVKLDQRELDTKRKKDFEEVERMKEEEMVKIRKEKKNIEQRSKNLQLTNNSNRKDKEEIDGLKRELTKALDESKAKEQKSKMTTDRMRKQIDELLQKNKELQEEVKYMDQLRQCQMNNASAPTGKPPAIAATSKAAAASGAEKNTRYTFSAT